MNGADEYTAGMCGLQHIGGAVRRVLTKLGATGNGVKAEVSKGPRHADHAGCWRGPNL